MYLAATQEMGLTYAKGKVNEDLGELTAWCDASWHSHKSGHGHTGFFLSFVGFGFHTHSPGVISLLAYTVSLIKK